MTPRLVLAPITWLALSLAMVLQLAWAFQPLPVWIRFAPLVLTVATFWRPAAGLLVFAGLSPLADALGTLAGSVGLRGTLLEQLVLSVVIGVGLRRFDRVSSRLSTIAVVLGVIVAGSVIAAQPALLLREAPGEAAGAHLSALLAGGYFERGPMWTPLHAGVLIVEGLALTVAVERVVRLRPNVARPLLMLLVLGTAALAGLNLERLASAAARSGDFLPTFGELLVRVRVSRFYDVNAAGSVFVMTLFAAAALLVGGRRHLWVLLPMALLAAGLWVSGSRTALAAFPVVALIAAAAGAFVARGRLRWAFVAGLCAVAVGTAVLLVSYPPTRNVHARMALRSRVILAETGVAMWKSAPIFGVGVGRFQSESTRFGADSLRTELGMPVPNENAHNYFLQMLAECGVVGLAALIALLGPTLFSSLRRDQWDLRSIRPWIAMGVVAYLVTWLAGHPQLVPEAAVTFWFLFGLLAGMTAAPQPSRASAVAAIIVVAVIVSVPFRARAEIGSLDLEHVGVGLSSWRRDDAVPYREAGQRFAIYLPADGSVVKLPVRRAPHAPQPLRLSISARGTLLNEVGAFGDSWQEITIVLRPEGRRFELVHFVVTAPDSAPAADGVWLHVGRTTPR